MVDGLRVRETVDPPNHEETCLLPPKEALLRCLTVRAVVDERGDIDGLELELFMNRVAGPHQWLSTTEWLFVEPPVEVAGEITVPVVCPENVAVRAILADLTNEPRRILFDLPTTGAETRKWRFIAFCSATNIQGKGVFPWETPDA
jgi:hypothetical protein